MFPKPPRLPRENFDELARFTFDNAPILCKAEHGCQAYHRVWPLKRWLQQAGRAPSGYDLYASGLRPLLELDGPRVLVSGGADTGLLAMCHDGLGEGADRVKFLFSDICATTVALNRKFARDNDIDAEFFQSRATTLDIDPVDAIVSHSFLGFFEREHLPDLFANWARLLRPGGRLVFTNNVRLTAKEAARSDNREALKKSAEELAPLASAAGYSPSEVQQIKDTVIAMLPSRFKHTLLSEDEIRDLLDQAGFELTLLAFDPSRDQGAMSAGWGKRRTHIRAGFHAILRDPIT